jgi:hypothetical protein
VSLRTSLLPVADTVRSLASPQTLGGGVGLDTWINSLTVRTTTWSGGRPGVGTPTHADLLLTPNPELREVTEREIVGSGGRYTSQDIRVQHITPAYPGGGYTPAQLVPDVSSGAVEVVYIVQGPLAGEYTLVEASTADPFEYKLTLRRRRTTPK